MLNVSRKRQPCFKAACLQRSAEVSRRFQLTFRQANRLEWPSGTFNVTKRFGFIVRDDGGQDAFVHASDVEGGRTLREGDTVEFDLGQDDRGRAKAVRVRVLEA